MARTGRSVLRCLALALAFAACEDCRATGVEVVCAASDSPEALKAKATFVCPEGDARPVLQKAIDEADRLDVPCVLLR
ncbi:MAG: hypothetical protein KBT68_02100, partial [bacterium]|nr:hypothetical protein [Candidatus Colisoma equi]